MKKYIYTLLAAASLSLAGCDEVLERPQLNTPTDETYWATESDLRLYSNGFYVNYFVGYASGWTASYAPLRGYTFDDNLVSEGKQSVFENKVPSSRSNTNANALATYLTQYVGPQWNFTWVRRANIFLDRLENRMKGKISEEAYNHWHAVASFYKCFSYARLVAVFGDVPYFEKDFSNAEKEEMFKDRDSRVFVMDKVYDMLKNDVLVNMRVNDGNNTLNRYVAAAFAARWMLFEGTWQKYHNGDQAAATKYLTLAKEAAKMVMNSGQYAIDTPFHQLFGSQDLKGNKEALMYRHYDNTKSVTHCVASYSNGNESQAPAPNLALIKSFICQDGKVYQKSDLEDADVLSIANLIKTRDPRFEATFMDKVNKASASLLYSPKFTSREGYMAPGTNPIYNSMTNTNDCPVIRYAEVLLSYIEAAAELGGVTQADIDATINVLRHRPLDSYATAKGLQNTADMKLADITADFDPDRDPTVDPLIWEIRRERRMELVYEHCRLHDIKRWGKLEYMDNEKYPDTMLGPWVDLNAEIPAYLASQYVGKRKVKKEDGTIVTFDGTNAADMVGYYVPTNVMPRDPFTDRSYLSPVGTQDIQLYKENGFTLTQTTGW